MALYVQRLKLTDRLRLRSVRRSRAPSVAAAVYGERAAAKERGATQAFAANRAGAVLNRNEYLARTRERADRESE